MGLLSAYCAVYSCVYVSECVTVYVRRGCFVYVCVCLRVGVLLHVRLLSLHMSGKRKGNGQIEKGKLIMFVEKYHKRLGWTLRRGFLCEI